ncbi:MAG TPA: hypothetical protein VNF99_12675 [Stellaceae bacterium]|nr:hypothetical protein [Stellaceae bacterium]
MPNALIRRLRRNLAGLIDPEINRPPEHTRGPRARAVSAEMLYDRLRALGTVGRSGPKTGQVNLVSIARIKERLGSEWPRHAVNADRIARNAIERYLIAGDIYAPWKDAGYIVVFATLERHGAQIKCKLIGDEITRQLLGEDETDLSEIRAVEMQADGALAFSDIPAFEQLIAATIADPAADSGAARESTNRISPLPTIVEAETIAPGAEVKSGDPLAGLSFCYRPSWDPARGVISTYLCVARLPDGPGGIRQREASLVLGGNRAGLEALDFAILEQVAGLLDGLVREKRRLLITLPVRFETLAAAAQRRRYIDALRSRLAPEAEPLLVVELIDVPDGVPHARLLEISSPLRAHARAVIARLRPDTTEFGPFSASRIAAVGCDIGRYNNSELAAMQQMARFSRGAAKAGMVTYLRGIRSISLATAALGAGFAHIDGNAVAPPIELPQSVVAFSLFDLYNPALKG